LTGYEVAAMLAGISESPLRIVTISGAIVMKMSAFLELPVPSLTSKSRWK
jgi:hypothetical protein